MYDYPLEPTVLVCYNSEEQWIKDEEEYGKELEDKEYKELTEYEKWISSHRKFIMDNKREPNDLYVLDNGCVGWVEEKDKHSDEGS